MTQKILNIAAILNGDDSDSEELAEEPLNTTGAKSSLSVRTPDEILQMEFGPADLYLENGIFAKGKPFTIVGPGVLHHALTGKAGARKATGYNRTDYGRGSKALQYWTRGQLNVAPGSSQGNGKLVISCGKNSDAEEFAPFGIKLNPATMIYEVDQEFDLETWKDELEGEVIRKVKPTPGAVAELVSDLPLTRKDLTDLVMESFNCGKSTAYTMIGRAENKTIRLNAARKYETV